MESTVFKTTRVLRTVTIQVCEARNLPKKAKGVFATVHVGSQMGRSCTAWKNKTPLWADEFTFDVADPMDVIKVIMMQEKKKGVQKVIGELRILVATLQKNDRNEAWLPLSGEKAKTVGDIRLKIHYAVDIILPTLEYNPFLKILTADGLELVRLIGKHARENKSEIAYALVNIFEARRDVNTLLTVLVADEIAATDTPEVLFRSNSVSTKSIDHFMKHVGLPYLYLVVKPLIASVLKVTIPMEVDKNRLEPTDDVKKALKVHQQLLEETMTRIFSTVDECPWEMRRLFHFIDSKVTPKFPEAKKIRYTAVGGFIFLRFFVPAIMSPKLFGLMDTLPEERHGRAFTILAGVVQKLANLVSYRDSELYVCQLNDFVESKFPQTKDYIEQIIDVHRMKKPRLPTMNLSIQIDQHVAQLVRYIESLLPVLKAYIAAPIVERLFEEMEKLQARLEQEMAVVESEERIARMKSPQLNEIDTLLDTFIRRAQDDGAKRKIKKTLLRPRKEPEQASRIRAPRTRSEAPHAALPEVFKHVPKRPLVPIPSAKDILASVRASRTTSSPPSLARLNLFAPKAPGQTEEKPQPDVPVDNVVAPEQQPQPQLESEVEPEISKKLKFMHADELDGIAINETLRTADPPAVTVAGTEAHTSVPDVVVRASPRETAPLSARAPLETPRRAVIEVSPRNEITIVEDADQDMYEKSTSDDSDDDDDEEDEEEIEVIEVDRLTLQLMELEFGTLERLVNDIRSINPPEAPKVPRSPQELIPELSVLEGIANQLEQVKLATLPKKKMRTKLTRLECDHCHSAFLPGEEFLMALDKYYHVDHLRCNRCNRNVSDIGFQGHEGKPHCAGCYSALFEERPTCAYCLNPIQEEEYVSALGKDWHAHHFFCTVCRTPFPDGSFIPVNDLPYCETHASTFAPPEGKGQCAHCGQEIFDSEYMEAIGQRFHTHHFLCDMCGKQLEHGTFAIFGRGTKKACAFHFQK